jgi:26S proteasome regulatory subunit N9
MDLAWKVLDQLSGVDNAVNAAYYGVAADYYKVRVQSQRECGIGSFFFLFD